MIVEERINNNCIRTYSSDGKRIKQVESNLIMDSAIDAYPNPYTYIETDEIPPQDEPTEYDYADVGRILMGVDE